MKYIFLIAAFNAFFFVFLLMQKKTRSLHDNILITWLIYLGLFIGIYSFYSHELFTHFRLLSISLLSLFMLHGPFLYFYVLALVSKKTGILKNNLFHLIPFILFNLYILIASFNSVLSEKLNIEKISFNFNPPLLFIFFLVLTAFSGTTYFILTIRLFRKFDIDIFNNFSNSSNIDLYWIRKLVFVFGVLWTALISVTVIHHIFHMFSMVFCTDGLFLSLSVFVILIGYFGLKQKVIFADNNVVIAESPVSHGRYSASKLSASDAMKYSEDISSYMVSTKPYLNPDLTLPQLASELNLTVHLLSCVINEEFELNFFDFVNRYRVEAVKEKIADPAFSNFSLLGIAFECGFNSKSAFNRVFKKETGLTPSQYRSALL